LEEEDETLSTRHKKSENKTSSKKENGEKKADSQTIPKNKASLKEKRYLPDFHKKRKTIDESDYNIIQEEGEV